MSLLPEDATYFEQLQAFFLAFRGDGVALSPLDAELLREWHEQGVPYEIVCRGIRQAAESLIYEGRVTARVRTLRSCRHSIEREMRRFEGLSAGRPRGSQAQPKGPEHYAADRFTKAHTALSKALSTAGEGPLRKPLERSLMALGERTTDPREVSRRIARADETLALLWARSLPLAERRALVHEASELAGPKRAGMSRRARKDALRAHLVALARARGRLIALL